MIPGSANPLLLTSAAAGGYSISRSVRLNSGDSAYLSKTFASAGNRKTWTWAGWVKRSGLGTTNGLFETRTGASDSTIFTLYFPDGSYGTTKDALAIARYSFYNLITTQVFRDPSAWYHIVLVADTTQATASNRLKLYVNGSQITSFTTASYPSLNQDLPINSAAAHEIGRHAGSIYLNGYLADVFFVDGQALTPTSFGEFDDNGIWQPKAFSGGSYGTNGFHLDFSDNSTVAALGTDTSSNGNDWTVNNITAIERSYTQDCTGTPFTANHSFTYMFDGNLGKYMTPAAGTWAVFEPSPAISVSTIEIYGGWAEGVAGVKPKINNIEVTNGPTTFQWFTPTLTGGVSITSLQKLEFYSDSSTVAFHVGAIKINGSILINASGGQDSLVDVPTNGSETDTGIGGEVRGNYCTLNPLITVTGTLSNGNLDFSSGGQYRSAFSTFAVTTGKWYLEGTVTNFVADAMIGVAFDTLPTSSYVGSNATSWGYEAAIPAIINNLSSTNFGSTYTTGDTIGLAFDADTGKLWFAKNGTWQGSGNPAGGTNPAATVTTGKTYFFGISGGNGCAWSTNFGQRPFAYTAPSGYKALCTANLPEGTITTSGSFTGNANADGPFVWLNGVPTAMTINGNAVTFATHADKLSNGFKVRSSSASYNTAGSNTYSVSTTGAKFKYARAQPNP